MEIRKHVYKQQKMPKKTILTSFTTLGSAEKSLGNNQGIDVPIDPSITPAAAPIITSDFNSVRACFQYLNQL